MQTSDDSRKGLWVIVGVIVAALAILSILLVIIIGNLGNNIADKGGQNGKNVASDAQLKQYLNDSGESIKKSIADQKRAVEVLEDQKKRVRLGS